MKVLITEDKLQSLFNSMMLEFANLYEHERDKEGAELMEPQETIEDPHQCSYCDLLFGMLSIRGNPNM